MEISLNVFLLNDFIKLLRYPRTYGSNILMLSPLNIGWQVKKWRSLYHTNRYCFLIFLFVFFFVISHPVSFHIYKVKVMCDEACMSVVYVIALDSRTALKLISNFWTMEDYGRGPIVIIPSFPFSWFFRIAPNSSVKFCMKVGYFKGTKFIFSKTN